MYKKRILVNAYAHVNLGDDLFLKVLFEKFPDTQFTLLGNAEKYRKIFKNPRLKFISFPDVVKNKYLRKILSKLFKKQLFKYQFLQKKKFLSKIEHEFDAVVNIGGSIFIENNIKNSFQFGNHKLIADVFEKKPKFILGSNFGPYKNESYLDFFSGLLKEYTDVCFRDDYSKSLFSTLNNVRCFPDVVFSGTFEVAKKIEKSVGISVMDFSFRKDLSEYSSAYKKFLQDLIKLSIDKNYKVYLFSFCEYEGDERAIDHILSQLDQNYSTKVEKVFYSGDIDAFLHIFSGMEIMYSSRFHAMILSMIYRQKIHPIIYSKKMSDVLNDLHYKGNFTDVKNIGGNTEKIYQSPTENFVLNSDLKISADKQFSVLEKFINS